MSVEPLNMANSRRDTSPLVLSPHLFDPFKAYAGEFFSKWLPDESWEISYRYSSESANLCLDPHPRVPFGQEWLVSHSLCRGTATFSSLYAAERHIATLFRCHAKKFHNYGMRKSLADCRGSQEIFDHLVWMCLSVPVGSSRRAADWWMPF